MPQLLRSLSLVLAAFLLSASAQTPPAWQSNTPYGIGAKVLHNGVQYTCLQAHTSQIGWEPSGTPALWQSGSTTGVAAAPPPPPPTAASPAPPPSSSGSCWAPWNAGSIYTGGATVSYQGKNWRAAWWTQGEDPASHTGVGQPWVLVSTCSSGSSTSSPATSAPSPSPTTHAPTAAPTAAPTTAPTVAPTVAPGMPVPILSFFCLLFRLRSVATLFALCLSTMKH